MSTLRVLHHLVRADLLERVRRYSFLIVLGLTIAAGYLLVPSTDALYVVGLQPYDLNTHTYLRGQYNSAWIGSMVAAMTALFLSLFGFYLVKNAVERDRQTRVGEIIASTPVSRVLYTLGKWLSNFCVLAVMVGTIGVAALAMQLIRGEEGYVELWKLVAPFMWLSLPPLAVVAALAILFETINWLRGGLGNVVYFFLWAGALPFSLHHLSGMSLIEPAVMAAVKRAFPNAQLGSSTGVNPASFYSGVQTFRWEGIQWTLEIILVRLVWLAVALLIALTAALFFARFDPGVGSLHRLDSAIALRPSLARWLRKRTGREPTPQARPRSTAVPFTPTWVQLTAGSPLPVKSRFWGVLLAELRLMLKGRSWWWYAVALGLLVSSLVAPLDVSRALLLPLAWIWPLLIWSSMGVREVRYRTDQLVFAAIHPLRRQLPATWLGGVIVATAAGSGLAVRLVAAADWAGMLGWAVGALFIPSLALALGVWSGSSKLFEVIYTVLWYIGPVHQVWPLDFMGASSESAASDLPLYYLGVTVILAGLAALGRRRQLAAG